MKVTTDGCLFGAFVAERCGREPRLPAGAPAKGGARKILDVGAGTGLLSLMLAQKTNSLIDAIEIEGDAFEQARENISASPWKDRINIFHTDAREFSPTSKYDVIISNPPFYENELRSPDGKRNVAHHGGLPLSDLFNLISQILTAEGEFYLLLPAKRAKEASRLLSQRQLNIVECIMIRQSTEHDYFRMFVRGVHAGNSEQLFRRKEMAIWNGEKKYTQEFIELLQDYYLYL